MSSKQAALVFTVLTIVLALYSAYLHRSAEDEPLPAAPVAPRNQP
ncbi:MAG: hypothetical protein FD131_3349 [Rhodocyclaceae bacterium]|jgi:hypothetical protein|nr:MAG: hypothetical protein FD131_3349 [Rhodocyclaceae bacterium]